ncbi:helix-turn-helix domain-containing protein [Azospirillum sp. 412522]|nr:helix-turn-helix domain-containing protein [Azospirillum sp. 412522]MBY6265691.1 helix-turn-helix domain-containing protein [Azospirillum sp. 412522]
MAASLRFPEGVRLDGAWHYWRPSGSEIVELGIVHGQEVSLPPHFHDEDQLTFVLSGRRRFVMEDTLFAIGPGEGASIPAGTPHRSLAEPADVVGINIYTSPGSVMAAGLFSEMARLWRRQGGIDWRELAAVVEAYRCGPPPLRLPVAAGGGWERVGEAARLAGMSREGFSRRFRRLHGMPPQEFRLSGRLNEARRLLRVGQPLADVAAEAGFSDQSHLGRCFRRAFGVTPGQYRRSVLQAP